jgi:hypothetical protein
MQQSICSEYRSQLAFRALALLLSDYGISNATKQFAVYELGASTKPDYMVIAASGAMHEVDRLLSRFFSHALNDTGVWVLRYRDVAKVLARWDVCEPKAA